MNDDTGSRKADHLKINIARDVNAKGVTSGFDDYAFEHQALPEIDLADVDTSIELLGKKLDAPLLVSCMTGGTPEAQRINAMLARVAEEFGIAMGLGSARALIEKPDTLSTFDVRPYAPNVLLLANLGAVQLNKGYGVDQCRRLMDMLGADALVLHLNALQEAIQPEGDTNFRGLLAQIATLCKQLNAPVVVKEVGWGIGPGAVRALFEAGVTAIDVAGAGGTSWSEVERYRIAEPWRRHVAAEFAGWGIPTTQCIREARSVAPRQILIASGGIRNGIDVAKAIALGADAAGIAGPFLRAADVALDEARDYTRELIETLRIAMFCTASRTITQLRETTHLRTASS
ncbi:MAG TPA: type 2 isopentenyl-diphosphate Delta-isomerase [Candidatus Baltobacteraceae bacterium]|nr:type 2 isopentenyl-diphosphate Delta-isomerase [Candidatus Baltobacteraceae bacterium]